MQNGTSFLQKVSFLKFPLTFSSLWGIMRLAFKDSRGPQGRNSCRECFQRNTLIVLSFCLHDGRFFVSRIDYLEVKPKMPNAKVLSEKKAIVASLEEQLKGAASGVLVDYKGITVAEDTALRAELRQNDVQYSVVKNTLVRFALNDAGLQELDGVLNGTTSLATSAGDPIAPMRVVNKHAKKLGEGKFNIKGGFMDGKVLSLEEIMALAELPPKDVLQAQALGMMLAPITSLAIVLKAIAEKDVEPAAKEEAPAEETPAAE